MPPTPEAAALIDALRALPLVIDSVSCSPASAVVPDYPGGVRPSSVIRFLGTGATGSGEHVGWTAAEHDAFLTEAATLPCHAGTLGSWLDALPIAPGYGRAACEAAAIDLALRQRKATLFALASGVASPVRYVVSFDRRADPVAEARRIRTDAPVELKIDVDPAWTDEVWRGLAALGGVAVLDFKGGGTPPAHERAQRFLPDALLEDPGDLWPPGRVSVDSCIGRAADIAALPVRPAAVNVKAPRMGGVFEALRGIATCQAAGLPLYVGGMFEVGVGRRQAQALAALFCADGPNDVAPIGVGTTPALRPSRVVVDDTTPGFGV